MSPLASPVQGGDQGGICYGVRLAAAGDHAVEDLAGCLPLASCKYQVSYISTPTRTLRSFHQRTYSPFFLASQRAAIQLVVLQSPLEKTQNQSTHQEAGHLFEEILISVSCPYIGLPR